MPVLRGCPFCDPEDTRVFGGDHALVLCLWDAFPVSPGHALVVPRRHIAGWFDATRAEQIALLDGIETARAQISQDHAPDGYNIGVNVSAAAGQTVPHLHVHVIPRYAGDVLDPRGGVRHVIPGRGNYLSNPEWINVDTGALDAAADTLGSAHARVSDDTRHVFGTSPMHPLLPALVRDLAGAVQIDLAVAFILETGLRLLLVHLEDLLDRGGSIRVLTGDYLDATEPEALQLLLDLQARPQRTGSVGVDARVFETQGRGSFHPKAYMLSRDEGAVAAYVGSSNISRTALESAVEWNYRFTPDDDPRALGRLRAEFDTLFLHPNTRPLTHEWVQAYERRRRPRNSQNEPVGIDAATDLTAPPTPHDVQQEALAALIASRRDGQCAGLVVLATGLGKTWLAAFDSAPFERILFVAHREEILLQARDTFRRVRPLSSLGLYAGGTKDGAADVLFASIATLGRLTHLSMFARDRFNYIVVDEFHHAEAATYRRLIDYFEPKFLLGLTATPDRTDGGNLLWLCANNLVYQCDLLDGIRRGLLSPFHYLGVPDVIDYSNIAWRSGRFDALQLEALIATRLRAENAFAQWSKHKQLRTLAFCASTTHATFMSQYFSDRGARSVAVHSGPGSAARGQALDDLTAGRLDILFSVDMLNEGVDVPLVDTVLMLRPTESKIVWLQQFGRGLRRAADKQFLQVIDYIGNHRVFTQGAMALLPGAGQHRGELSMALERLNDGEVELPPGCEVVYELEALNILRALAKPPGVVDAMTAWFRSSWEQRGVRPTASDALDAGFDPRSVRSSFGGWLAFVDALGALSASEARAFAANRAFLLELDTTAMTKSYKMLLLLAMIAEGQFPGVIDIRTLVASFRHQAMRTMMLRTDVGADIDDDNALRRSIEQNPIKAWVGGLGTGGRSYFTYAGGIFAASDQVQRIEGESLAALTRELCEWRLSEYQGRSAGAPTLKRIRCRLGQASGRPILWLPSRANVPNLPLGVVDVEIDGVLHRAKFMKIAVNVVTRPDSGEANVLPRVLTAWFGPAAGAPGHRDWVVFQQREETGRYVLAPEAATVEVVAAPDGPEL